MAKKYIHTVGHNYYFIINDKQVMTIKFSDIDNFYYKVDCQ